MITKNWHKAKWNESMAISSSSVHPKEGMAEEIQAVVKCLGPAEANNVKNALVDLSNLLQYLKPSTNINETFQELNNNHTAYANVFDKLNTVFKSALNNKNIRTCLNMHPNSPVNKYIEEIRETDMKDMKDKLEILHKINAIMLYYGDNIALFKNDLMQYLTVSVDESNLPPGHKVLHTETINKTREILNKLGQILSNNSSSIYTPQQLNKMNNDDMDTWMNEKHKNEQKVQPVQMQPNSGSVNIQPRMPQNNMGITAVSEGASVNIQPRMP